MNDPIFLRMQSKAEAKARIQEAFWPTFAAGAIYVLPITALTMLSMLLPFVMENYPIWLDAVLYLVELVFGKAGVFLPAGDVHPEYGYPQYAEKLCPSRDGVDTSTEFLSGSKRACFGGETGVSRQGDSADSHKPV